ncbi:MAG: hypothetical protein JOZ51_19350, partial [Chloroflexi bacterium]|nr:hypothetical protein [Chloroflexota bacterium]
IPDTVRSYACFSEVVEPGAWRSTLERHAPAVLSAPAPRDMPWLPQLVAHAQLILEARHWAHVQQRLPGSDGAGSKEGKTAEETLQALRGQLRQTFGDRGAIAHQETWPVRLLDTLTEQLAFLKGVA